jgi:outer membrane protein
MTKFLQRSAITAVLAFAMFTQSAQAQALKIAVVDIQTVVTAMPEYVSATNKVEAQTKAYQDTLETMRTKYQATLDSYAKLGTTASDDMKKKEQEELQGLNDNFTKFQSSKFGTGGELDQMKANLMKPITDKLQNTLDAYRRKEKLSIIIPKASLVSFDSEYDQTSKFQDFLKAQP